MSKGVETLFIIVAAEYYHDRLATWVAGVEATQKAAVAYLRNDVREFMRFLHDDATEEQLDELLESDQLTWDKTYTTMGDDFRMCTFDDDDGLLRKWNIAHWQAHAEPDADQWLVNDEVPS